MPSTFGQWLIVILALLVGLAGGWALWGRQKPTTGAPIVEGDPVVGLSAEEKAAAATIDAPRPVATVDNSPAPAAVVDELTPHPAPDADHTTPTAASTADDSSAAAHATAADGTPTTLAAERSAPLTGSDAEPTTAGLTGRTGSDEMPASTDAGESTAPVPAPRATVEDTLDIPGTETGLPEPTTVDPEPVATDAGPAASGTETGTDPLAAPSAETTQPAEPVAAEPDTEPVTSEPAAVEPVTAEPAAEPTTQVSTVPDLESTTPETLPDPDLPVADEVDTAPVAVAPVVPAQRTSVEDTVPAAEVAPVPAAAPLSDASPAQDGPADDFRRIQGVGPKMAAALQAAGIQTYQQLAALDESGLRETIRAAGLRATASLATWPQQAKVLAGAGAEAERVLPTPTGGDTQD
ncbi:helix-hairpin-helix domain-containing protein [Micromonospora matsumotoense]|uniref:helix-hairpin-helix domain-containing protein n=1 Tax=Micromonospora matsumotoense TaxID=121616 RepID=UPI003F4E0412